MRYFTIKELCVSSTAASNGINNVPSQEEEANMLALIEYIDLIREAYGKPVYANSGFRCKALNELVGGSKTSQHMTGEAVDLDTRRGIEENIKLFNIIRSMGGYDQLIDENNYAWVHVSRKAKGEQRGEILRYKNGKYERS